MQTKTIWCGSHSNVYLFYCSAILPKRSLCVVRLCVDFSYCWHRTRLEHKVKQHQTKPKDSSYRIDSRKISFYLNIYLMSTRSRPECKNICFPLHVLCTFIRRVFEGISLAPFLPLLLLAFSLYLSLLHARTHSVNHPPKHIPHFQPPI